MPNGVTNGKSPKIVSKSRRGSTVARVLRESTVQYGMETMKVVRRRQRLFDLFSVLTVIGSTKSLSFVVNVDSDLSIDLRIYSGQSWNNLVFLLCWCVRVCVYGHKSAAKSKFFCERIDFCTSDSLNLYHWMPFQK